MESVTLDMISVEIPTGYATGNYGGVGLYGVGSGSGFGSGYGVGFGYPLLGGGLSPTRVSSNYQSRLDDYLAGNRDFRNYNLSKYFPTNVNVAANSVSVTSSEITNTSDPNNIQRAELRTDQQGNRYISLASAPKEIAEEIVARMYGVDLNKEGHHRYTYNTAICFVSNPKCTIANVYYELRANPTPTSYFPLGVNSGDSSNAFGNPIVFDVNLADNAVTNITVEGHMFHYGVVYQTIFRDGDLIGIRTIGVGTGPNQYVNTLVAPLVWAANGVTISSKINNGAASPFFAPTTWDSLVDPKNPQDDPFNNISLNRDHSIFPENFDGIEYLASNPDLSQGLNSNDPIKAANHWENNGRFEGRPYNSFDYLQYLAANPGLAQALGGIKAETAERHYINDGYREGRQTHFDYIDYLAANGGLAQALGGMNAETAERHYINNGVFEGRPIHFDTLRYIASYGDLIRAFGADLNRGNMHYVNNGYLEGRTLSFDPAAYEAHNPDVAAAYGSNMALAALHYITHGYYEGRDNGSGHPLASPVILDLDGHGIDIALHSTSTVTFDVMGTGTKLPTAWAGAHSGMLVIDLDAQGNPGGDGRITLQHEVDFSSAATGGGLVDPAHIPSDMQALAELYDTNGNGQLDPGDARWGEFKVWQDHNQDGITDSGELQTLTELGITAIGLVPSGEVQHLADGTIIRGTSTYTLTDGTTRTAADVQLAYGHTLDDTGAPRTVSVQSDLSHVPYVTTVLHDAASGSDVGQIDLSQNTQGLVMDLNETSLTAQFFDQHGVPLRSIIGSAGDDILLAGQDSRLTGGAGSDLFELSRASGHVTIADLLQGVDHIHFGTGQIKDFTALQEHALQVGNDVEIQVGASTSLTLQNIQLDHLNAGSFLFA